MTEADPSAYLESIRALVAEHGHAVQQVAPDDEESLGRSYTIGLHAAGLPDSFPPGEQRLLGVPEPG